MRTNFRKSRGFTLLEVLLSLGILAVLSVSIFRVVATTVGLSKTMLSEQRLQMHFQDLETYLSRCFSKISPDATFELTIDDANQGLQNLRIIGSNISYPSGERDLVAYETVLQTEFQADGLLRFVQSNFPDPSRADAGNKTPSPKIKLVGDLIYYRWEFYDPRTRVWVSEWLVGNGRPALIRFVYQPVSSGQKMQQTLWLPPSS